MVAQKRKASGEEQQPSVREQLRKVATPSSMKNNCLTFFTRAAQGKFKKVSEQDKKTAAEALEMYK